MKRASLLIAAAAWALALGAVIVRDARSDGRIPADADVVAINAKHLYPGPEAVTPRPHYTVLGRAAHPLRFLRYQYEGYTRRSDRRCDPRISR